MVDSIACAGPLPHNQQVVRARFEDDDWSRLFAAVTAARTALAHHLKVFDGGEGGVPGLVAVVVSLVATAVSHKRSVVQSNGLRCMTELFRCVGSLCS